MNCTPLRTRQRAMVDNEGGAKTVASFYRDDSNKVSFGLPYDPRPNIIAVNFSEGNAGDFHLVMNEISGNVPATSENFRRISADFRTIPERC